MATKAEKRKAALAKREAFLKEERERGLAAQRSGQREREIESAQIMAEVEKINQRHRDILRRAFQGGEVTVGEYLGAADAIMGPIPHS